MRLSLRASIVGVLLAALALLVLAGLLGIGGDPDMLDIDQRLGVAGTAHWLGTDGYGRDIFGRLAAGAVTSAAIAVASVLLSLGAGMLLGGIAGFFGGWIDRLAGLLIDALLAFPGLLLALAMSAALGGGAASVILALGIAQTPVVARQFRASVQAVREREFVEVGRLFGHSRWRIFREQILPNSIGPVIILSASLLSGALLAESALSFLGVGVSPPQPTWGNMLAEGRRFLSSAPWLCIWPGLAITLTVLAVNLAGDLLRDRLDPHMQERG
ncbi:MAG: ABC transporter permease [Sphingopyxis sp.]|jgi:peptide/nickel transport system permease protein|uniref:ABC transporter permease n=1 Tax=Sphingopyxis sp. TaxID=1908224 RepID=UPI001A4042C7|nr:ABC transporter permease [Sphingopyxis sp.]MBL9068845.1 ABC transporter permease [Sphingopyxis sp.]